MARGTTLTVLLTMLRAEAGQSSSVAAGVDNKEALMQKLQRCQTMLYDDFDWPFMTEFFDIALQAGQRYYDLPHHTSPLNGGIGNGDNGSYLNMERIEEVAINYSGKPSGIERGIGFPEYAQYNSDSDERASPVRKWDIKSVKDSTVNFYKTLEMVEVWPIPTDNTQILSFKGIRQLRPLVAPADVCDIDDVLIVLTAASEILARSKQADASKIEAAAAKRKSQMQGRVKGASRLISMSGRNTSENANRGRTIIRIGSQTN